jgi:hypothetical protein
MVNLPYSEHNNIRIFSKTVKQEELQWHWDEQDRYVAPVHPTDWKIQLDNELPKPLTNQCFIPKGVFHRLIKGSNDLTLRVIKK